MFKPNTVDRLIYHDFFKTTERLTIKLGIQLPLTSYGTLTNKRVWTNSVGFVILTPKHTFYYSKSNWNFFKIIERITVKFGKKHPLNISITAKVLTKKHFFINREKILTTETLLLKFYRIIYLLPYDVLGGF